MRSRWCKAAEDSATPKALRGPPGHRGKKADQFERGKDPRPYLGSCERELLGAGRMYLALRLYSPQIFLMNLYVGTSGYSYKEWKGTFYPKDLGTDQMLRYYGERFRSVEINNTFYRMPKESVLEAWAQEVPGDFKFVLKASQRITHMQRLKDTDNSLPYLLKVASALKDRLGPLLFQLPPYLKKDVPRLRDFLALLPSDSRAAFEFRHESWFEDEVFALLRQHQVALCIAEAEDGVEVPFVSTADWGYLRLRRPDYGDPELKAWWDRVSGQNWSNAFVFFKHEDEGKGPIMAKRFLELAAR